MTHEQARKFGEVAVELAGRMKNPLQAISDMVLSVVKAERDACAKIAKDAAEAADDAYCAPLYEVEAKIRARGESR